MNKQILLILFLFATTFISAQKVWNFGSDDTTFPLNATGIGTGPFPVVVDGLSITGISTNANMAVIEASAKTFTNSNNVAFTFKNRMKFNGAGYASAAPADATPLVNMPIQRYLSFNVSGNSTIYVIGVTGSNSSSRNLFVTDGTTLIGTVNFPVTSGEITDGTITYTGGAATLYVFCNNACNLYYLSATNVVVPTSVEDVFADSGIRFDGRTVINENNKDIEVYSVVGKLIGKTNQDFSMSSLPKGVYLVKAAGLNGAYKFVL